MTRISLCVVLSLVVIGCRTSSPFDWLESDRFAHASREQKEKIVADLSSEGDLMLATAERIQYMTDSVDIDDTEAVRRLGRIWQYMALYKNDLHLLVKLNEDIRATEAETAQLDVRLAQLSRARSDGETTTLTGPVESNDETGPLSNRPRKGVEATPASRVP